MKITKGDIRMLSVLVSVVLETGVFLGMLAFQSWLLNTLQAEYTTVTEELLCVVVMIGVATEAYLWFQPRIERLVRRVIRMISKKLRKA